MSPRESDPSFDTDPGLRWYALLGMGTLTIMIASLLWRRGDPWALLPGLLGALGLAFRWRAGPLYVLLAVVLVLLSWWIGTDPGRLFLYSMIWLRWWIVGFDTSRIPLRGSDEAWPGALPVADLLLALSLLVYAAAQYRLQGLTRRLFPPDPRRRRAAARQGAAKKQRFDAAQRRSPVWVTMGEIGVMLAGIAVCAVLAMLFEAWLMGRETNLELDDPVWRGIVVLWILGGCVLVIAAVLRYLALRHMTRAEAQLYLQDLLWQQTRREQRRVNRWLAWAWLGRRRREENES